MSIWARISIERKIGYVIALITIAIIASVTLVLSVQTYRQLLSNRLETARRNLVLVREKLELIGESVESYSKVILTSAEVQDVLVARGITSGPPEFTTITRLHAPLNSIVYPRSIVDAIIVHDLSGYSYFSGQLSGITPMSHSHQERLLTQRGGVIWNPTHISGYTQGTREIPVISLSRAIYDSDSGRLVGFMEIFVAERSISDAYAGVVLGPGGTIVVTDEQGMIISATESDVLFSESEAISALSEYSHESTTRIPGAGGRQYVFAERLAPLDWFIIGTLPARVVVRDILPALIVFAVLAIAGFLAATIAARLIATWFSRPILQLVETMNDVASGDLEVRVQIESEDEFALLGRSFNDMLDRMSALVEEIRESHEHERTLELQSHQMKINPHFLYNTLDTISGLAETGAHTQIPRFVQSLSRFYRRILGDGRSFVTVDEELDVCRDFLSLLSMRYPGHFSWSIESDSGAAETAIPRLIVQPIVENAVFHGLRPQSVPGSCIVRTRSDETGVLITVSDDGIGFTRNYDSMETVEISRGLSPNGVGYGLAGVRERLQLFYRRSDLLLVESEPGTGTTVSIRIPSLKP